MFSPRAANSPQKRRSSKPCLFTWCARPPNDQTLTIPPHVVPIESLVFTLSEDRYPCKKIIFIGLIQNALRAIGPRIATHDCREKAIGRATRLHKPDQRSCVCTGGICRALSAMASFRSTMVAPFFERH